MNKNEMPEEQVEEEDFDRSFESQESDEADEESSESSSSSSDEEDEELLLIQSLKHAVRM